ncbi:MAG: TonB-dependent receptor [Gammaproteobacteria bacterium]|nr:TonB-dependent receptor [Gammaproteobacteria bacterium]MBU2059099.1 TonB-dependent receptor [Gammaproteobacteria bacterium]MBU2173650.1 TonB-dependent receptor [Gammaproteobacteria bacterium]MBU2246806.1 TonB-dependent receptor [Gammaproteobacteria bacterium]MBU2343798.1 TonB-dependent receptor [Gammaproteobacteria bacterium]
MKTCKKSVLALSIQASLLAAAMGLSPAVLAQESDKDQAAEETKLERIMVTAQKRVQSTQEVPISIATLSGEKFDALFAGGEDIQALSGKIPGLYAESSNGRAAPRFYIRGLGNTDFDLAASQPVSVIMDEVVMENVILKSFPLFDVAQAEVIRGPQGTLFGRNTTAGIVKFTSVKPTQDFEAYTKATVGSFGTINVEGAVGGGLTDELSARISLMNQNRDDYVDNGFTGEKDFTGGHDEKAGRLQFLYDTDSFSALFNVHGRKLDGTSSLFRANVLTAGSNKLNENYDRDTVYYDDGDGNFQKYDNFGASLTLEFELDGMTFTSITAQENADGNGKGDIDGGVRIDVDFDGTPEEMGPGFIPFGAVTEDQLNDLKQFTQEIRLASDTNEALEWQVGAFYFDSSFGVTSIDGFFGKTDVYHENTSWAVFGQTTYNLTDRLDVTAGIRYTYDEKSFWVGEQNIGSPGLADGFPFVQDYDPINVDDGQVSWELSSNYRLTDKTSLYGRLANGFRAQSIQGRDVAFEAPPSVAESETITSVEVGAKSDLLDDSLRLNGALFYYNIDDIQLSAIGGATQGNQLINADRGVGYGFEVDAEWRATKSLVLGGGFSYNKTELKDQNLLVAPCGSQACTPTDRPNGAGLVFIDGNPFPQAPETILTLNARYDIPVSTGEIYLYGDVARQGKTNLFLYESMEYHTNGNFEAGLRIGYLNFDNDYEVALFGRNITDEDNLKGAIDFNNLTGFVNEPRIIGVEFKKSFF